jgi:hypothetical protein
MWWPWTRRRSAIGGVPRAMGEPLRGITPCLKGGPVRPVAVRVGGEGAIPGPPTGHPLRWKIPKTLPDVSRR